MIDTNAFLTYALPAGILLFMFARKKMMTMNKNVKNITGEEAATLVDSQKSLLILDVRTPSEFSGGHLPGAQNIPVQLLPRKIKDLEKQSAQPVLVYCASGGRSPGAVSILLKNNFTDIYHLSRGISSWRGKVKR